MTPTDALIQLQSMVAYDQVPTLTVDELNTLVTASMRADVLGNAPLATTWTPTYDLNSAAAKGWRLKAGKAAGNFDITNRRTGMRYSQILTSCLAMAKEYDRRIMQEVEVTGTTRGRRNDFIESGGQLFDPFYGG